MNKFAPLALLIALASCETPTAQRYSISAANNVALRALPSNSVTVGQFQEPKQIDVTCRLLGPVEAPDGLTYAQYVRKALEDELKVAGAYAATTPKTTLTGVIDNIAFSSSTGITGGVWDIGLTVTSSNGQHMSVVERYTFKSGFSANEACRQTAQAFMPAVQDLIQKLVTSPEFTVLVQP